MMTDNKSNHAESQRFTPKNNYLKAGDMVQVLPVNEIRKTLDENNQTEGLMFMPEMQKYCGTKRKILKRVKYLFDEHAWRMKKIKNIVILKGVICNSEDKLSEEGCDRGCYFFWAEKWLKKIQLSMKERTNMNVAIFSRENYRPPWNEGYKNMTRNLVKRLKNKGDSPIVISSDDIEKNRTLPASVYKIPLIKGLETIFILRRIIKQHEINLFFKFTPAFPFFGVRFYLLEKILGIPFYMYVTSASENRLGVKFLLNSKRLFVVGDFLKTIFPKAHLVYPLIDLDNLSPNNNRKTKTDKKKVILFLGGFHKQRGVQYLIKAMAQLNDKSGIKLLLAWNGGGECESEIRALIRELNLEQITEIRGNSNIAELYEEAHVVVIPRIYKKGLKQNMFFPLRIIEALVFQKPMIISDIYEWGSIIKGWGLATRPGNVEDLRDAINKMITDKDFYDSCVNECPIKLKKYHPDHSFSVLYTVFQNGAKNLSIS